MGFAEEHEKWLAYHLQHRKGSGRVGRNEDYYASPYLLTRWGLFYVDVGTVQQTIFPAPPTAVGAP